MESSMTQKDIAINIWESGIFLCVYKKNEGLPHL